MNSIFRSGTRSKMILRWLAPAIAGVVCLLLTAQPAPAVVIDRIAIIVNGDVVTQSELTAVEQLGLHVSALPDQDNVIQERIDHHLVLQQVAKQPPLAIPPEKVQETIDAFVKKYGGTEELLVFLNSIGMNYQDFETEVREQLSIQAFITQRFRPFADVTIDQAQQYYDEVYKLEFEKKGQTAPAFAFSFEEIQNRMIESQVRDQARKWLQEIRASSLINVKE